MAWMSVFVICNYASLHNGMLRHSFGIVGAVICISLLHFIAPALDLMPCLQVPGRRDCKMGISSKKEAINYCDSKSPQKEAFICIELYVVS